MDVPCETKLMLANKRIEKLEALIDRAIRAASMYRDQPIFKNLEQDMRKAQRGE